MTASWDAVVIGAGPAGMAAATALAKGGARTLLVDEQPALGGQIYRAAERNADGRLAAILGSQYAAGAGLVARLRSSGAELKMAASAWRIDESGEVWTKSAGRIEHHVAPAVVLATGALERPVPVEGWTLPGVTTIGALQIILKTSGAVPDGHLVLAGSGPLFYLFASQCRMAGVERLTLLDTAPAENLAAAIARLPKALTGKGRQYLLKGAGMLMDLRGITRYRHVRDLRLVGLSRVEAVEFIAGGKTHSLACDRVGLHEGVIPHQQASRLAGCEQAWDRVQLAFAVRRDAWGRTSKPAIFVVGDAAAIIGAAACVHDGTVAALAILADQGRIALAERDRRFRIEDRARRAHLSVRPFLDRLYRPRDDVLMPPDAAIVCRCENVTAGAIREAVAAGCPGPQQAKAFLRCGMGPCQGRSCGPTVSGIMAAATRRSMDDIGYYRIRPPLKPITVGELSRLEDS